MFRESKVLFHVSFGSDSIDSTVYGECVTGGLIGSSGSTAETVLSNSSNNKTILSLENCSYQKVTIVGGICSGGFVGSVIPNYGSFATYNKSITPGSPCKIQWTESKKFGTSSKIYNLFFKTSGSNGVGGLIGLSCAPFTIKGDGEASVVMEKITLCGGQSSNIGRIGGVVGFIPNQTAIICEITNIELNELSVGNSIKYDDNTGGFIGTWYSRGTLTISESSLKSSTVQGEGNGGIVGYAGYSGTIYVKNVVLEGNTIQSRGGPTSSFYSGGIGGYIVIDFYGQNILLKNTKYIYSTTNMSDRIGRFLDILFRESKVKMRILKIK